MNKRRLTRPDKELLITKMKELGSVSKLAAFLNVSFSTAYKWCKDFDINTDNPGNTVYHQLRDVPMLDTQKSVVLGSVLGDGCLKKPKRSRNARLNIGHCDKQLSYLRWKQGLLQPFATSLSRAEEPGPKIINGVQSRSDGYTIMGTISHPDLNYYYNHYYFDGKKCVHPNVVGELDWLSLAVWLADDGSFHMDKGCKFWIKGSIATNSFNDVEQEYLLQALKKFYKGGCSIAYHSKKTGQKNIYLRGGKVLLDFLNEIVFILPPSIHYKFAPQRLHAQPLR